MLNVHYSDRAPEIYACPSHAHGTPSDWFSMGVTLHELATGRRPFDSKLLKACAGGVRVGEFSLHWLHNCDYLSHECQSFISKLLHSLVGVQ
jgi:serine/threonine protein kinase